MSSPVPVAEERTAPNRPGIRYRYEQYHTRSGSIYEVRRGPEGTVEVRQVIRSQDSATERVTGAWREAKSATPHGDLGLIIIWSVEDGDGGKEQVVRSTQTSAIERVLRWQQWVVTL